MHAREEWRRGCPTTGHPTVLYLPNPSVFDDGKPNEWIVSWARLLLVHCDRRPLKETWSLSLCPPFT